MKTITALRKILFITAFVLTSISNVYSQVVMPDSAASGKRNNIKLDTTLFKKTPTDLIKKQDSLNHGSIKSTKTPETDTVIPPRNKNLQEGVIKKQH